MSNAMSIHNQPRLIVPSDLIGSPEVCEILSIDRATVVRRVNRGTLPYLVKLSGANGSLVFDRNDILALGGAAA